MRLVRGGVEGLAAAREHRPAADESQRQADRLVGGPLGRVSEREQAHGEHHAIDAAAEQERGAPMRELLIVSSLRPAGRCERAQRRGVRLGGKCAVRRPRELSREILVGASGVRVRVLGEGERAAGLHEVPLQCGIVSHRSEC